jgi:hypothetical protein
MFRWRNSSRKRNLQGDAVKLAAPLIIFFLLGTSIFGQNAPPYGQNAPPSGAIKATTLVFPDRSTATTITDPEKHTSEETVRDAAGRILRRTVYPLNDRNFARGAIHYDAKGVVVYKEVYVFDYAGRITESKLFTKDNQPKGKLVFVYEGENKARIEDYDEFGNLITLPAPKGHKH